MLAVEVARQRFLHHSNSMKFGKAALDAELVFDSFLGHQGPLERLQAVLRESAPKWSQEVHIRLSSRDRRPVNTISPDGLRRAVLEAAGHTGPLYDYLVAQLGVENERLVGSAELRGATGDFLVVIGVDEVPLSRTGECLLMGNRISIQIRKARIEGSSAAAWLRRVFLDLCAETSPVWAYAGASAEYWAKVMTETPSISAEGRDFARFLPGMFWLNFFGKPYIDLMGTARVSGAPAAAVEILNCGVFLQLFQDPRDWDDPSGMEAVDAASHHLGEDIFYVKDSPGRVTRAPSWKD